MARVLIVEDEHKIAQVLADYLQGAGFESQHIDHGDEVLPCLEHPSAEFASQFDAILLDLMLPGLDGLSLCREIRARSSVPILMVTARVEEIDRLLGLELGADDYICKPFSPREVVARVRAVLRRGRRESTDSGELALDIPRMSARLAGQPLELTAVEFQLLATLAGEPGRIYSRQSLMDSMYNDGRVVSDRTVDSHIKKLRKKLQSAAEGRVDGDIIHSVYGVGYKLELSTAR